MSNVGQERFTPASRAQRMRAKNTYEIALFFGLSGSMARRAEQAARSSRGNRSPGPQPRRKPGPGGEVSRSG